MCSSPECGSYAHKTNFIRKCCVCEWVCVNECVYCVNECVWMSVCVVWTSVCERVCVLWMSVWTSVCEWVCVLCCEQVSVCVNECVLCVLWTSECVWMSVCCVCCVNECVLCEQVCVNECVCLSGPELPVRLVRFWPYHFSHLMIGKTQNNLQLASAASCSCRVFTLRILGVWQRGCGWPYH